MWCKTVPVCPIYLYPVRAFQLADTTVFNFGFYTLLFIYLENLAYAFICSLAILKVNFFRTARYDNLIANSCKCSKFLTGFSSWNLFLVLVFVHSTDDVYWNFVT